jgi:hypothetical protein
VDSVIIYALACTKATVLTYFGIRFPLEAVFVVVAAIYGGVLLAWHGTSPGRALLGYGVAARNGGGLTWRQVLLREVLGKWLLIGLVFPLLGRVLMGGAWVPTVYDLLAVAAVVLLLLILWWIMGRPWYEVISTTVATRAPGRSFALHGILATVLVATIVTAGLKVIDYTAFGYLPARLSLYQSPRSLEPYVEFLERGHPSAVDYVLGLFDNYDVVVLCERLHPEATQWSFIFDLVSDIRFQQRVGHIFTEYGERDEQEVLDSYLLAPEPMEEEEARKLLLRVVRNNGPWPVWTNTNFHDYLVRLHRLNQSLPAERRIHHYLTDLEIPWEDMETPSDYEQLRRQFWRRDESMAQVIIDELHCLHDENGQPPKALVIMNYRHAFRFARREGEERRNTAEFLFDAFPGRTANVLLNMDLTFLGAPLQQGTARQSTYGIRPWRLAFWGGRF